MTGRLHPCVDPHERIRDADPGAADGVGSGSAAESEFRNREKPKCGDREQRFLSVPLGRPGLQPKWAIRRQWDMDEQISDPSRSKRFQTLSLTQATDARNFAE